MNYNMQLLLSFYRPVERKRTSSCDLQLVLCSFCLLIIFSNSIYNKRQPEGGGGSLIINKIIGVMVSC